MDEGLDWQAMTARLESWRAGRRWRLDLRERGDSSNDCLLTSPHRMDGGAICLLHAQTAGRGTNGRVWRSWPGRSLTFSVSRPLASSCELNGLSLAVGAVLARTLARAGAIRVDLKWPNDLLHAGRKLGGVLVETRHGGGRVLVVVGVGVNLLPGPPLPDRPVVALSELCGADPDRLAALAALLLRRVACLLAHWPEQRAAWLGRWQEHDVLRGRRVRLPGRDGAEAGVDGIATGIDRDGRLQIQTRDGPLSVAAGEVTVRFED